MICLILRAYLSFCRSLGTKIFITSGMSSGCAVRQAMISLLVIFTFPLSLCSVIVRLPRRAVWVQVSTVDTFFIYPYRAATCDRSPVKRAPECSGRAAGQFQYRQYTVHQLHRSDTALGGVGGLACVSCTHLPSSSLVTVRNRWRGLSNMIGSVHKSPSLFFSKLQ